MSGFGFSAPVRLELDCGCDVEGSRLKVTGFWAWAPRVHGLG